MNSNLFLCKYINWNLAFFCICIYNNKMRRQNFQGQLLSSPTGPPKSKIASSFSEVTTMASFKEKFSSMTHNDVYCYCAYFAEARLRVLSTVLIDLEAWIRFLIHGTTLSSCQRRGEFRAPSTLAARKQADADGADQHHLWFYIYLGVHTYSI